MAFNNIKLNRLFDKKTSTVLLLGIFVAVGLFYHPQEANAWVQIAAKALGFINDAAKGSMDALDFVDNSILRLYVWLTVLSALAAAFLAFSAGFVDWTSSMGVNLTSSNQIVSAGWNFTSGLVNVFFILIFITIAFFYIFKAENFGMKKALPRLIIMAILINFSLLFVKMLVDIGWLVQNAFGAAFFDPNGNFVSLIVANLKGQLMEVFSKLGGQITNYALWGLLPIVWVAKVIRLVSLVAGEAFMGTLSQSIMLIFFGFAAGLIFFVYGIIFLARIIVIWLLAIAAPLALAALILPQTQKYFHQWFKALVQWVFAGIVILFLMGLGVKLYAVAMPAKVFTINLSQTGFGLTSGYAAFIFLLTYLVIVLAAAKKFLPAGMNAVWGAGEAMTRTGIMATGAGGLAVARAIKTGWGSGRTAYTQARSTMNLPRGRALRWAVRRGWTEPGVRSAIEPKAATRGVLRALGNAAKAGAIAGAGQNLPFGLKLPKKKGTRKGACPVCGKTGIAAAAQFCPQCGYDLQ